MPPKATIGDIGTGPRILVDADACPVKEEIYKVAFRHAVPVAVVSNSHFRVPAHPLVRQVVVSDGFDAADDWIAERVDGDALIVTGDILLADRGLKAGGTVIAPNGKPFTAASIGGAIATRAIMADLRAGMGQGSEHIGGPPPFRKSDRSQFLQVLDREIVRMGRRARPTPP
ncbi:YaiI/YqxD family protein [Croceicoccus hydrothermalis]|uniref:YaiI/YqxD family protein n=1 Tax=Croceicoccus hydrothermalis TaxID=2867964 RepID=UPI001EFA9B67|nr:YaiI/YqxD family protein [Croceicoccus hydrothermalis]